MLTGIANYTMLNTAAPMTDAIRRSIGWRWLEIVIEVGAIAGLSSVQLVNLITQPRIYHAMARDGLFPAFVAKVHPTFKTPYVVTIMTG